jgi:hypothetical protein
MQNEIQLKIDAVLKRHNDTKDERAIAIISALFIENEIDMLLSVLLKKYSIIRECREMTLSFKTDLAISFQIMPNKILNAIEPIRKIRNIFAHNLNINTFEEARKCDIKTDKIFRMLYDKIRTFYAAFDKSNDLEAFKFLTMLIMLGLQVYSKQIDKVNKFIWNRENLRNIMKN